MADAARAERARDSHLLISLRPQPLFSVSCIKLKVLACWGVCFFFPEHTCEEEYSEKYSFSEEELCDYACLHSARVSESLRQVGNSGCQCNRKLVIEAQLCVILRFKLNLKFLLRTSLFILPLDFPGGDLNPCIPSRGLQPSMLSSNPSFSLT